MHTGMSWGTKELPNATRAWVYAWPGKCSGLGRGIDHPRRYMCITIALFDLTRGSVVKRKEEP